MAPARISRRSDNVLFPWSMWAMIEKLRICIRPYKGVEVVHWWKPISLREGDRMNNSVMGVPLAAGVTLDCVGGGRGWRATAGRLHRGLLHLGAGPPGGGRRWWDSC